MRSWSLAVAVTALLIAAGSLVVTVGVRSDHPAPPAATAPLQTEAQAHRISAIEQGLDQALRDLEEQRRQTEALRELVDDLLGATPTAAPTPSGSAAPAATAARASEGDTSLATLDPFGTQTTTSTTVVPEEAEREIRAVLARVDDERRRERERRQEMRQLRRTDRVIRDVRERLGLSDDQAKAMTEALLARDLGRRKAWSDDATDVDARRAAAAAVDQTYEQTLQQLLSPSQYEELQAVRKESASGGGRGRQRRGRRAR